MKRLALIVALALIAPAAVAHDRKKPEPTQTVVVQKNNHDAEKILALAVLTGVAYVIYQEQKRRLEVKPRADGAVLQFTQRF